MTKSPEQEATHQLMLACRRLSNALHAESTIVRKETARCEVVERMSTLLQEFGLVDIGLSLDAAALSEFYLIERA